MTIAVEWIKNLRTDKERTDFEEVLRNSTMVADRILELLDEWENDLNAKDLREADFDTPNWEVKQAARIGDRRRIHRMRELFSFRLQRKKHG